MGNAWNKEAASPRISNVSAQDIISPPVASNERSSLMPSTSAQTEASPPLHVAGPTLCANRVETVFYTAEELLGREAVADRELLLPITRMLPRRRSLLLRESLICPKSALQATPAIMVPS